MTRRSTDDESGKPHGFFWRSDAGYHVVILHKSRKVRSKDKRSRAMVPFSHEFVADTPEALIEKCQEPIGSSDISYDIGTPERVKELCESAPRWAITPRRR